MATFNVTLGENTVSLIANDPKQAIQLAESRFGRHFGATVHEQSTYAQPVRWVRSGSTGIWHIDR